MVAVLQKKLDEVDAKLRRLSGDELLRAQGRAQQLEELLDLSASPQVSGQRQELAGLPRSRPMRDWTQP